MFDLGICLETSTLFIISLDLIVAVYPLLLLMVTYLMITLHDRNFRLVVVMWSPFRRIFSLFCDKWDIRSSVIDSFATFFFLSNVKFLSVAYDLLIPVQVYQLPLSGNFTYSWRLYHNGTTDYFGSTHLPYAILAIVVLVVFVLLPVLILMLYPFRWFQKILKLMYFLSVGMSCTPSWTHSRVVIKMALNQAHEIVDVLLHSSSLSGVFYSCCHILPHTSQ